MHKNSAAARLKKDRSEDYKGSSLVDNVDQQLQPTKEQQLEEEREIVEASKRFVEIFEQKIKDKISEVWGE